MIVTAVQTNVHLSFPYPFPRRLDQILFMVSPLLAQ